MAETSSSIQKLLPALPPEQLANAEEILRRYFAFLIRLQDRIASEVSEHERFRALTSERPARSMEGGRTFTNQITDTDV